MAQARSQPVPQRTPSVLIRSVSLLFFVLSIAAIAGMVFWVTSSPTLQTELQQPDNTGGVVLAFLNEFGIFIPLIAVAAGVFFARLGIDLWFARSGAAGWARQVLLWLAAGALLMFGRSFTLPSQNPLELGFWVAVALGLGGLFWALANSPDFQEERESLSDRSSRVAWNLLLPSIAILIVVALRPLEQTFIASLTDRRFASAREVNFVGLDNYAQLLGFRIDSIPCTPAEGGGCQRDEDGAAVFPRARDALDASYADLRFREMASFQIGDNQILLSARDRDFMTAVGNTLTFTFWSVSLELLLGLGIAMIVNSKFAGRGLMRTAMLVPWAIPTVVSARLWEIMLRDNQSGVINAMLMGLGLISQPQAWLANGDLQIPAIIMVDVWKTTPFMALILLAGLQVIPSDIYEAAEVDGANKITQFFRITLPLLRPTIAVALVFRTLDAIRAFDVFQVLLERQKLSMATYNYEVLIQSQQFGYASTVGVVIFLIILLFTIVYVRSLGVSPE